MATLSYGGMWRLRDARALYENLSKGRAPKIPFLAQSKSRVRAAAASVARLASQKEPYYGINTGFGALSDIRIRPEETAILQENIVRSHAAGVGAPLRWQEAMLAMILRLQCLSQGYSGVRLEVLEALNRLIEAGYAPLVPSQGSVGACGDLAPLAHIARVLLGEGEMLTKDGEIISARHVLDRLKIAPVRLAPKEGLALVNGTQVSLAIALGAFFNAMDVLSRAVFVTAMSVDALEASRMPFEKHVAKLRNQPGAALASGAIWKLLAGSEILTQHKKCGRVQDSYSFRCAGQVLGSAIDTCGFAAGVFGREINAVTDNPLIVDGRVISNGNFHAQAIAACADYVKIAMAEVGSISERRLNKLVDDRYNPGVPAFLTRHPGLESGLMMVQVTAAALVSENKSLAHPQSVDSIPTSLDKEDHVSMAPIAARFLASLVANLDQVIACECLGAFRSLHFRRPRKSGPQIERAVEELAAFVSPEPKEQAPAEDIAAIVRWFAESKTLAEFARTLTVSVLNR